MTSPWRGVVVATATPYRADLTVDEDAYAENVRWLAANGCSGVSPNGSLGEYQVLSDSERARMVTIAVETAPPGFSVIPGVGAYGGDQARRWAEQAAAAGAAAVLCLPPNAYAASPAEVVAHYREVARAGLPIVAYNNPFDTRVDLVPVLLARLAEEVPEVVAVKEFSGDARRVWDIRRLTPRLDVLAGADDVVLELLVAGAVGWIAGFPNALPEVSVHIYELGLAGDYPAASPLYELLRPLYAWDSRKEFIQAVKLSMDIVGRPGGATRLPRLPLSPENEAQVRKDTELALTAAAVSWAGT